MWKLWIYLREMNKVWKINSWVKRTLSKTTDTHRCLLILFLGASPQLQFNLAVHVDNLWNRSQKIGVWHSCILEHVKIFLSHISKRTLVWCFVQKSFFWVICLLAIFPPISQIQHEERNVVGAYRKPLNFWTMAVKHVTLKLLSTSSFRFICLLPHR